ncbi:hypothetical protein C900_04865 [Fulvivirga imtechensis AK7]|uniref:DUF4290 domain-containing protein n=1 Tax=Fulvivirga imtechensis AK7 TaxID=1237149 RepID=L8JLE9_9BACT|nr:DUF4290 domain-containing protein [Fulvivirga imtechensis]ELR69640.1 hypothetical protein C900_04865 [Fulvivirga imtechensis AK7]
MEYNTSQPALILKEYGRNVQKLVEYLKTIEDKEKRTQSAATLVELMKQITPTVKETPETSQKLWDDLYIMSNFDLDIDSPYPMPAKEVLNKKPKRMDYTSYDIKYKHYGRNIDLLVKEAIKKEDPQEREDAIIYIGKLMKSFYTSWNKEVIDDAVILENINTISGGALNIDLEKVKEDNLFEKLYNTKRKTSTRPTGTNGKSGDRKSTNRRRRRN